MLVKLTVVVRRGNKWSCLVQFGFINRSGCLSLDEVGQVTMMYFIWVQTTSTCTKPRSEAKMHRSAYIWSSWLWWNSLKHEPFSYLLHKWRSIAGVCVHVCRTFSELSLCNIYGDLQSFPSRSLYYLRVAVVSLILRSRSKERVGRWSSFSFISIVGSGRKSMFPLSLNSVTHQQRGTTSLYLWSLFVVTCTIELSRVTLATPVADILVIDFIASLK